MKELIDNTKKSVVFFGKLSQEGTPSYYATGFFVSIKNIFHLVTAKHVIYDKQTGKINDKDVLIFFNLLNKNIGARHIDDIKSKLSVEWMFHDDPNVDIAIIPFGFDPKTHDIKVVPDNMFLTIDNVYELYDVFFLSLQPGIVYQNKISPILRTGTVSIINDDNTFYIDASAFPGNSGSPLFLKPSPIRFDQKGISIGGDPLGGRFIGIIGEYLPYSEVAISIQTGKPRVIFEENTGLSMVWSVSFIKEIENTERFKNQIDRLSKS